METTWTSRIVSPHALSMRAWVAVTPVGIVAAPLAAVPAVSNWNEALRWMLFGLIAQVPMGAVMVLGNFSVRRFPWPRALTLLMLLLAGAVRGLTIALIGEAPDVTNRAIASAVTMTIWLLVIGAALESHDRYRKEVDALLATLVARELHGRLLDDKATEVARRPSAERLAQTSHELRVIVSESSEDHARTAAMLQAAIETRLRPLSHDLWFAPTPTAPQTHTRLHLLGRILTTDVPAAPLAVPAFVLLAWGSVVLHRVWLGALVGLTVAGVYLGVLSLANAMHNHRWTAAAMRYLGTLIAPALAAEVTIWILNLGQPLSAIPVALGLPLITFGVASAVTLSADRSRTIADLQARLVEPDWDRHLGELVRRKVDERTASLLHNSVQPVLTATALQLQLASTLNDPGRARDALERAMRAIDAANSQSQDFPIGRRRLEEAAEAWQGIADVEIVIALGDVDEVEWDLLADVVHESVANAVRHGHASSITFDIQVNVDDIAVTMIDNGAADGVTGVPGLGTTWLQSVALSVQNRVEQDGRRVSSMFLPRTVGVAD